ncbi:hypothetical protein V8C26DRAFT_393634 [Trichoderma gracile]
MLVDLHGQTRASYRIVGVALLLQKRRSKRERGSTQEGLSIPFRSFFAFFGPLSLSLSLPFDKVLTCDWGGLWSYLAVLDIYVLVAVALCM